MQLQILGAAAIQGEQPGIDAVGLGPLALEAGEHPGPGAVGTMQLETQGRRFGQHMPFIAAGGFADHQ